MAALIYPPTTNGLQKTLGGALSAGTTASATLNNTTGIQNLKGVMVIDRVDTNGVETPTLREYISFTGTSGSTVVTLTRGLGGSTDQAHAVGAIVEFIPDVVWAQALIDTILVEHNNDGTHNLSGYLLVGTSQTVTGAKTFTTGLLKAVDVTSGSGVSTFPTTTDTLVGRATTDTLTNKRITKRVLSTNAPGATPTLNTDSYDVAHFTGLNTAITSMTSSLSGTPVQGDTLRIDFTDDGTARAISWGSSFEASGTVALPTTTVISTRMDLGFVWNTVTSKWRIVAWS